MHLDAHVKAQDKEIEIDSYSQTPVRRKTLAEILHAELGEIPVFTLFLTNCPDISNICEESSIKLPEHRESVFQISFQLHVASLAGNGEHLVALHPSGTQVSGLPAPHAVRSSAVELPFKRQRLRIAVSLADAT